MNGLADFLLARIAEDEALASGARGQLLMAPSPLVPYLDRFSGSRAILECEAKRRIVAEHPLFPEGRTPKCGRCDDDGFAINWPCLTLRLLALPYADHPDCLDEWRPLRASMRPVVAAGSRLIRSG